MKFFVETYGCALNKADSRMIKAYLKSIGLKEGKRDDADFYILNTCIVKKPTEDRMRGRIKKLSEEKKEKGFELVVFGCFPRVLKAKEDAIYLKSFEGFEEIFGKPFDFKKAFMNMPVEEGISIIPLSYGCFGNCSYCIVKLARKKYHSIPPEWIIKKMKKDLKKTKLFYLTSQDSSTYLFKGKRLPELMDEIATEIKEGFFARIGMWNPKNVLFFKMEKEMINAFSDWRFMKFFHIPLQSGSDRILELMNRKYTFDEFYKLWAEFKENYPLGSFVTDIIVGFPGENMADFQKTLVAIKKLKPGKINVSRYGDRPFTIAEKMKNKIKESEKKKRSRILYNIARYFSKKETEKLEDKTLIGLKKGNQMILENFRKAKVENKAKEGNLYLCRTYLEKEELKCEILEKIKD